MKAAAVSYARPDSLDEALSLLSDPGIEARVLAGGQSLIASLNMRLSQPALLVDIAGVPGLDAIEERDGVLRIGAMVRHAALARSDVIRERAPLIAQAIPHIAHPAIRNRGTIGGSLALGDPATELPACCLALDAIIVVAGRQGERRIPTRAFFRGLYETALAPAEVLTAVEIPIRTTGAVAGFGELARRHGDYALVGLAAHGVRSVDGWSLINLAFFGAGDRPLLAEAAARAIVAGQGLPAAQDALAQDLAPMDDLECAAATKQHLARVLLGRVLADMAPENA